MPVQPGIFSYRGWTALSAVLLVLFGSSTPCRAGEERLEIVLVMDNSSSMAKSDQDFTALAGADLLVSLLRPGDRLHLVSAGAEANVVLEATGDEREKIGASLRRLHREASATDHLSVYRLLNSIYEAEGAGRPLVFWFTGRHFTYNVNNAEYYGSEDLIETWISAQETKGFAKDPFKVKAFRDIQPQVVERIGELIAAEVALLSDRKVPVHMYMAGKQLESAGNTSATVNDLVGGAVKETGGALGSLDDGGMVLLTSILSTYVRTVNAPSQTVVPESIGRRGDSFEVFRGCRHLWVVVLFPVMPAQVKLTSEDATTEIIKNWPFGKPEEDIYHSAPHVEKGLEYKQKRWYRLPEEPVGFALYSIRDPLPGNYRIQAKFQKGETFLLRILQDVDLEYGFLQTPPDSIPLGMDFGTVAALKHPEGYSYVFNRGFLDDLKFQVLVRRIDGEIPAWGGVQTLEASREGETIVALAPTEAGTYYLKGKVSHVSDEFVAFMEPFRFDVYPRIPLEFDVRKMTWSSSDGKGWTSLDPPLSLSEGVELPPEASFRIQVDTRGVEGWEFLEFEPGESFVVSKNNPQIRFRVRFKDPEATSIRGGTFKGRIRLSVDEAQAKTVEGEGSWEIPVEGRIRSWGVGRIQDEFQVLVVVVLVVLLVVGLVVERLLRPSFDRDLTFGFNDVIGGRERTWTIPVGRRIKPIVPFVRQEIVVGRGGDAGLYREDVLCVIRPVRGGLQVRPLAAPVLDGGDEHTLPFVARLDHHYRVGGDEGRLEFWLTREASGEKEA